MFRSKISISAGALFLIVLCFLPTTVPAAPSGAVPDNVLVENLVFEFAAIRIKDAHIADEQERFLLAKYQATQLRLNSIINDLKRTEADRDAARQQALNLTQQKKSLLDQIASRDSDFAKEEQDWQQRTSLVVQTASPELKAALMKFSEGDRVATFPEIERILTSQNNANLRYLADLSEEMLDYGDGSLANAIKHWEIALDADPSYAWGWNVLAQHYEEAGRNSDALEALEKAKSSNSSVHDQAWAFAYRGDAYASDSRPDQASEAGHRRSVAEYSSAINDIDSEIFPSKQQNYYRWWLHYDDLAKMLSRRGRSYLALGDLESARKDLARALATRQTLISSESAQSETDCANMSEIHGALGDIAGDDDDWDSADSEYKQEFTDAMSCAASYPKLPDTRYWIAIGHANLARVSVAKEEYETAREEFRASETILEELNKEDPSNEMWNAVLKFVKRRLTDLAED